VFSRQIFWGWCLNERESRRLMKWKIIKLRYQDTSLPESLIMKI